MRDRIRISEDPEETPFTTGESDDLIDRYTHSQWMIDAKGMANNAMPKTFNEKRSGWTGMSR